MNTRLKRLRNSVMLLLALIAVVPANAKDVYGFMTGNSSDGEIPIGMYKYDTDGGTPELMTSLMYSFWGGTFADGKYMMILSDDASGYLTEGLCSYDLNTKALKLRYSQQPYQCTDLTYDYSSSTLYGVMVKSSGETISPRLIKINTTNGSYTNVAQLKMKIVALACTYYGDMYAMDESSNLYELDKATGELTLIGNTGVKCNTTEAQSMEFDRSTGELYWTGLDENYYTFFNKVNPETAEVVAANTVENNSLIVGLYIPFVIADSKAPAKPLNLSATANDKGVTLSWRNPTTLYGGEEATDAALTKVEIWRNGKLIHTIDNAVAGKEETYVDEAKDIKGKARYIVYAYNEAGRGEGASAKLVLGEDLPAAVTNLSCQKKGNGVLLSWTAPSVGKNGGSIKPENLTYTISRQPDGKVFENIVDTQLTDNTISEACYYTWQVVCKNPTGESDPVKTQPLAAGKSLSVPYTADFSSDFGCAQWMIVDHNNDGNTWLKNLKGYVYNTSYTSAADDSLVSVPFHLEKDVKYIVKYDILAPSFYSSEHFEMSLLGSNGKQVVEDLNNFTTSDFSTPESRKVAFTVAEDGDYRFCLAALSAADQFMIQISAFSVEAEHDVDLKVESITASSELVKGTEAQLVVGVKNNGTKSVSSYKVKLTDADNNLVASQSVDKELKADETATISLLYTPQSVGYTTLRAFVEADGDKVSENDAITAEFYSHDEKESVVAVGGKDYLTDYPFWFNGDAYNYSQTIYLADEINRKDGDITELDYDYINYGNDLKDKHIKVYLANTAKNNVTEGWTLDSEMELVVDDAVTFRKGENTLHLRLSKPFAYAGGNLCVMTVKEDNEKTDNISFYAMATDDGSARTALYHADSPMTDTNIQGAARVNYLGIVMKPSSSSSIADLVSDNDLKLVRTGNVFTLVNGDNARFAVTDLAGNVVQTKAEATTINLSHLYKGVYLLKVEANGKTVVMKVAL